MFNKHHLYLCRRRYNNTAAIAASSKTNVTITGTTTGIMRDGASSSLSSRLLSRSLSAVVGEFEVLFVGSPLNLGDIGDKVEDDVDGDVANDVDDDVGGDVVDDVVGTIGFYEAY